MLAETGILNGRYATTHWNLGEKFKERYPDVKLNIQRLLIDGGNYICAGGVSAWMDLALHLIKRYLGIENSLNCAKVMLMAPHREYQSPYGLGGFPKSHNDSAVLNVQEWLEVNYPESPNLAMMAEKANLSQRSLLRRFKKATGCSPIQYLRQIRVEAAQIMLEQTDRSVESISESVGYTDYSTFRKLFKQTIGTTPSTYSHKFGLRI